MATGACAGILTPLPATRAVSTPEIVAIAFALAVDAFVVGVGVAFALDRLSFARVSRLSFSFGFFQCAMPVVGWALGRSVAGHVAACDHWIALGLLSFVGGKLIYDSLCGDETDYAKRTPDPTLGVTLLVLSVATSIDALAVGLGLAFTGVDIVFPCIVIGVVACAMTVVGMLLGHRLGKWLATPASIAGGAVLIAIGIKIFVDHTCA